VPVESAFVRTEKWLLSAGTRPIVMKKGTAAISGSRLFPMGKEETEDCSSPFQGEIGMFGLSM
jgi:hypothetical protein